MPNCSVIGCGIKMSRNRPNITLHRLPRSENKKKKWLEAIGTENLKTSTKTTNICSLHFDESCFNRTLGKTTLHDDAVPSRFRIASIPTHHDSSQKKPSQKKPVIAYVESDSDQTDAEASIYERDLSPSRTEENEGGAGDATVPEGSSRRHEGYLCDVCRGDIVGFRYACVQCVGFDLCGACEARGEHAAHYVLRIPHTKLNSDVQSVIRKIRDQLLEGNEEAVKIEVKNEIIDLDEEQDPLEQTACPAAGKLPEASCQDMECESEDALALKFLVVGKQTVFKASLSHKPAVPQNQHHRLKKKPQDPSHQSQVLSHQSAVTQVLSHQRAVPQDQPHRLKKKQQDPSHQSQVLSRQSAVTQVLSHQPAVRQVLTHQPAVRQVLTHQPAVRQVLTHQPAMRQVLTHQPAVRQALTHPPAVRQVLTHQPAVRQVLTHQPTVRQVLTHQSAVRQVLTHQPTVRQVLTHQPEVPQVLSNQPQIVCHSTAVPRQPIILIQPPKVVDRKLIQSEMPQAQLSRPQVPATSQEKRPLILEDLLLGEKSKPSRKKRKK